jgi:uncharacterized protein YqfA (UPF0365 family)
MLDARLLPLIPATLALVVLLAVSFVAIGFFRLWIHGIVGGVNVPLTELIFMRVRRVDAWLVMKCMILSRHSGVDMPLADLQRAYLQGVDLEKLTLAQIEAHKQKLGVTFQELIELDLKDRLVEKLGLSSRA